MLLLLNRNATFVFVLTAVAYLASRDPVFEDEKGWERKTALNHYKSFIKCQK